MQAVKAGCQQRPVLPELLCLFGKFRPRLVGDGEIAGRERVFFEGDKMQAPAALRVGLPGLPDGEEVEAETKAGFEDDEAILALPALR